jgi:hypothetical protein
LVEFISSPARERSNFCKHLLAEPIITFESKNEAIAHSYYVRVDETDGKSWVFGFGRYHDRLVKQKGKWLFKESIIDTESSNSDGVPFRTPS